MTDTDGLGADTDMINSRKRKLEDDGEHSVDVGIGAKLMKRHGWKEGEGLGAAKSGRVEPVELSKQRGRRGLGFTIKGLEASDDKWDESKEKVPVAEEISWIPASNSVDFPQDDLPSEWMLVGKKKMTIDDECTFCDPEVLAKVLKAKSIFDQLDARELQQARTRANPYEAIKGAFFQNRAAMKMANMDAVFDFIFSNPKHPLDGTKSWLDPMDDDLFYFADICAGPGGFTEYILWRNGWNAHGFGFTLRGGNDFKLDKFLAASPETFEPYYGVKDDGDITNPENLKSFEEFVMRRTDQQGAHLVMADGGFSVEGQENIQEILSKRLYLCQFLCAVSILRPDRLHKENLEKSLKSEGADADLPELDVVEIVPLDVMIKDTNFFDHIKRSNEDFAIRQSVYLAKYKAYAQNVNLYDPRQTDLREQCLEFWKIPDNPRPQRPRPSPSAAMEALIKPYVFANKYDQTYDPIHTLRLPPSTLIKASEVTTAHFQEDLQGKRKTSYMTSYEAIDAFYLGGKDVSQYSFLERHRLLAKFCKSISRDFNPKDRFYQLRVPEVCALETFPTAVQPRLDELRYKGDCVGLFSEDKNSAMVVESFLFLPVTKKPWIKRWSKTHKRPYFFNETTGISRFEPPSESYDYSFREMFENELVLEWSWKRGDVKTVLGKSEVSLDSLSVQDLSHCIQKQIPSAV